VASPYGCSRTGRADLVASSFGADAVYVLPGIP
jgi:hypothetical protein